MVFQFFKMAFQFFKNFKSVDSISSQGPVRGPLETLAQALTKVYTQMLAVHIDTDTDEGVEKEDITDYDKSAEDMENRR